MAIQEIEVPDGKTLFPYFVDTENAPLAIECFASRVPIEYVIGEDGKPTEDVVLSPDERARKTITSRLDAQIVRYQHKKNKENATVITNIVS